MDRSNWSAVADSYQNATGSSDGPASNLIDGNLDSIWHSNYGGGTGGQSYPYNVLFNLHGETTFQSFLIHQGKMVKEQMEILRDISFGYIMDKYGIYL